MPKIIYKPQAVCDVDENISQLEMKRERKSREIMSKLAQRKEEVGKSNSKCFLFFFKAGSMEYHRCNRRPRQPLEKSATKVNLNIVTKIAL